MDIISELVKRAQHNPQCIVLPEGCEERTIKAADRVLADGVANLILIASEEDVEAAADRYGLEHLSAARIVDPAKDPYRPAYAKALADIRKSKGLTLEQADKLLDDPFYYGCMLIKMGEADGLLGGAINATARMLRPALQIIKTEPGITCVSGAMILITHAAEYGQDGVVVMGDVAVTPEPDAQQLAQIAVCTARTAHDIAGIETPKVGMLSFSTKGSASHECVNRVVEATRMAQEMAPDLLIDGELQADAALVPKVGGLKAPGSPVAGEANVLVVPRLEVGNIGYKLVQRLGHAQAIGPILQGVARPVNDLSRGCSVDDIYKMVAITANQAAAAKAKKA